MADRRDIPPSDPKQLADWLAPRPGETYEAWGARFDRAERTLARRTADRPRRRSRQRGPRSGRKAA